MRFSLANDTGGILLGNFLLAVCEESKLTRVCTRGFAGGSLAQTQRGLEGAVRVCCVPEEGVQPPAPRSLPPSGKFTAAAS